MRLVLWLIVIIAAMALIQSMRHGCQFGSEDWFSCVTGNTAKEFYSATQPALRLAQAEARAAAM